jgi:hypothetical protein
MGMPRSKGNYHSCRLPLIIMDFNPIDRRLGETRRAARMMKSHSWGQIHLTDGDFMLCFLSATE